MCVAFWWWDCLEDWFLVLAFNRDELFSRSSRPVHSWDDHHGHIVGGRDIACGGTWLATSRAGRVAFLTNIREARSQAAPGAPSRGALPVDFLRCRQSPEAYLGSLHADSYAGFNLAVADLGGRSMAYLCNRGTGAGSATALQPGLYGMSNAGMAEGTASWPKVEEGRRQLAALALGGRLGGGLPWGQIFGVLNDARRLETDPARLPDTGYGPEFEAAASSIFMEPLAVNGDEGLLFGTRSQTVLAVRRDGGAELRERYRTASGWEEARESFAMDLGGAG